MNTKRASRGHSDCHKLTAVLSRIGSMLDEQYTMITSNGMSCWPGQWFLLKLGMCSFRCIYTTALRWQWSTGGQLVSVHVSTMFKQRE